MTVLTAHATATNTIEAMRLGAFDHLTKPIGREDVARVLGHMLATKVRSPDIAPQTGSETLIGSSGAMRSVQKTIGILADSDATVLITGETGADALRAQLESVARREGFGRILSSAGCHCRHSDNMCHP